MRDTPLAPQIERVENAQLIPYVRPPETGKAVIGGVLRSDGTFVENSDHHIDPTRHVNVDPSPYAPAPVAHQKGIWLFGGKHDLRFGHFLVETLSRLWALDHVQDQIDGIIFLPERGGRIRRPERRIERTQVLFDILGPLPPIHLTTSPTRFDTLIVPPQGCGAGLLAPGCPEFRSFIQTRVRRYHPTTRINKLYVSRSALLKTPGQVVFESALERALAADGYTIFHPQDHDLETQVATYQAADTILGIEGSAFHLIAYTAGTTAKVGYIRRRRSDTSHGLFGQLHAFLGDAAYDLDAVAENFTYPRWRHIGNTRLDFEILTAALIQHGFVSSSFALPKTTDADFARERDILRHRLLGHPPAS